MITAFILSDWTISIRDGANVNPVFRGKPWKRPTLMDAFPGVKFENRVIQPTFVICRVQCTPEQLQEILADARFCQVEDPHAS